VRPQRARAAAAAAPRADAAPRAFLQRAATTTCSGAARGRLARRAAGAAAGAPRAARPAPARSCLTRARARAAGARRGGRRRPGHGEGRGRRGARDRALRRGLRACHAALISSRGTRTRAPSHAPSPARPRRRSPSSSSRPPTPSRRGHLRRRHARAEQRCGDTRCACAPSHTPRSCRAPGRPRPQKNPAFKGSLLYTVFEARCPCACAPALAPHSRTHAPAHAVFVISLRRCKPICPSRWAACWRST
jgi:hypothetical protein